MTRKSILGPLCTPPCRKHHVHMYNLGKFILHQLKLTDEELEQVIVMLVEGGHAPAADYLGRRLRAKQP